MSDALRAALDHVREHGFGDNVDADEIVENLAQDYLALRDREPWCNHDAVAVHNGRCECGAEIWYVWRVVITFEDEAPRMIIPRSNPHLYEQAADSLFATVEEARGWFEEELESWEEPDERKYMQTWVLCKETVEVVR